MKQYVMGIDGGGTKSHLAVFSTDGGLVGMTSYGALNHEGMPGSFAQLERELGGFVAASLADMGLSVGQIAYAVLGLAGADTPAQCGTLAALVRRLGLAQSLVVNDAYLGVPAGAPGGCGICAINGTGATVAAIDSGGRRQQVGGIGEYSDDCGGGTWYGTQVVAQAYNQLFRSGPRTALTTLLLDAMPPGGPDSFVERLTDGLEQGGLSLSALNRLLFVAAAQGDPVATGVVERSAQSYAGSIAHLATSLRFAADAPLWVTLAGSVFVKEPCPLLPTLVLQRVGQLLPDRQVQFVKLTAPPVAGAVLWALSALGQPVAAPTVCDALTNQK